MSTLSDPPSGYQPHLGLREMEQAVKEIKDSFEQKLSKALNLQRVTAPLFLRPESGLNDNLNGVEMPVSFQIQEDDGATVEVVQSLAKWKRDALGRYDFAEGEGLYTDMNALRPQEPVLDAIHSVYVDQWDWEMIISPEKRSVDTLREVVTKIYRVLKSLEMEVCANHPVLTPCLPDEITFVTTHEMQQAYPDLTPPDRETEYAKKHGAIFVLGIGGTLADGTIHDGRAPDYDDWSTPRSDGGKGLNGDIVVWNPILKRAFELSSMGIRVSPEVLKEQLEIRDCPERSELPFHQKILAGELPQTLGGGIGQSRLCMLLLRAAHIAEVSASVWPAAMEEKYKAAGVTFL